MKHLTSLLLATITLFAPVISCSDSHNNNSPRIVTDVEMDDLRGAVKSMTQNNNYTKEVYNTQGWKRKHYDSYEKENGERKLRLREETTYAADSSTMISNEEFIYTRTGEVRTEKNEMNITAQERANWYVEPNSLYKYNSDGYLLQYTRYKTSNYNKYLNSYTYNSKNQLIEYQTEIQHSSRPTPSSDTEQQEVDPTLLEYDVTRSYLRKTFEYNPQGDASLITSYDKEGTTTSVVKYTYLYDDHNNWIERTLHHNTYGKSVTTRTIEYWK